MPTTTMISAFDIIAHEDADGHRNVRRATIAAGARVEKEYGAWIRRDPGERLSYLREEIGNIVRQASAEYGIEDNESMTRIARATFSRFMPHEPTAFERIASTEHEAARMPRMCPFHKDVTEISLNAGDPSAGFSAMAQHWGGDRHCEGEGYKGESCKFKPQMTTQSYWDERAEKAEQRKRERAEREEQEAQQQAEQAEAVEDFEQPMEDETELPDNVIEVEFQDKGDSADNGTGESVEQAEVPMSMAAKTATETTGLKGPSPTMDKSRWSPKGEPPAVADAEDENSRWPTRRKDVVEPVHPENADIKHKGELKEIGEGTTEQQSVTKKVSPQHGETKTWTEGPKTAISKADDVERNPIIDMMNGDYDGYDGFTPQHQVDQAIVAHKRR